MLVCSAVTFLILVYFTQLLFFNMKLNFTHFNPTTQSKAKCLLFRFHVPFVGYRILQTLLLLFLIQAYVYSEYTYYQLLIVISILTYLTPVVGILSFLVLKHGWIYDLCIVYCTDYLSYLNTIQCNPNTGQETRQSIRADFSKLEFEIVMHGSHKYVPIARSAVNFAYPLLSIRAILLSQPNAVCLISLNTLCGDFLIYASSLDVDDSLSLLNLTTVGIVRCLLVDSGALNVSCIFNRCT